MKTKTILKTIGFFIGWLLSFQLIGVGTYLMNKPSSVAFTAGVVFFILNAGAIFGCAYKFSQAAAQLVTEYIESREVKQDKQE
jgi:uncharacterized membrane protein required for colicin V production